MRTLEEIRAMIRELDLRIIEANQEYNLILVLINQAKRDALSFVLRERHGL